MNEIEIPTVYCWRCGCLHEGSEFYVTTLADGTDALICYFHDVIMYDMHEVPWLRVAG